MNNQQRRILARLLSSLDRDVYSKEMVADLQADIEANAPLVENCELKGRFESAIFALDECLHLMDDEAGIRRAQSVCARLIKDIQRHISSPD